MKVCTDSCLFGAWIADWLQKNEPYTQSILDVGTGTSLLSLMIAQKLPSATIDAVEIESLCFEQAAINISQSPWKERIQLYHCDINAFAPAKQYDFIISNPPFYESDLASADVAKKIAHHNAGLTLQALLAVVKIHLKENGYFAVLLPYHRSSWFESIAVEEDFFVIRKVHVKQSIQHPFFRTFLLLSKERATNYEEEIAIKDSDKAYTPAFVSLLKDYYLYL